jgi:hypothetical protein
MEQIYDFSQEYEFEQLKLITPVNSGGGYFIKILTKNTPVYIQPPKCHLKQGFYKSGKKLYCDLVFSNENETFIHWMENLEATCCERIYENRAKWFENSLEKNEIMNYLVSPFKIYKSGKMYIMRVEVPTLMEKCSMKIYDENEKEIASEDLKENTEVITILEIKGIKCSARNFQYDIEMKQMLVLVPTKLFDKCIIHRTSTQHIQQPDMSLVSEKTNINEVSLPNSEASSEDFTPPEKTLYSSNANTETLISVPSNNTAEINETKSHSNKESCASHVDVNPEPEINVEIPPEDLVEIDLEYDKLDNSDLQIKERNDVYYKMYKDAKRKAKEAKMIALSNYLEAKRIKATYLLDDIDSEESDLEEFEKST